MSENEENMTDLQEITGLLNEHAECLAIIERATKRKLEIELVLSTVKEALNRLDSNGFGVARRPRGRPRKKTVSEAVIAQIYGDPVVDEDFGGNAA